MSTPSRPTALSLAPTAGATLFFALTFGIESGYSYGGALLLVASLIWILSRPDIELSREDHALVWVFVAYFLVSAFTIAWHGNNYKSLDQSIRPLLAIPILLYLTHAHIRTRWLWGGLVWGAALSVVVALWQQLVEGRDRVEGYLNIIHFGNLALIYAVFCIGGLFWASTQGKRALVWRVVFIIGIACSLYSVDASGSRGSWIAIPALAVLVFATFITRRRLVPALAATAIFAVVVGVQMATPDSRLRLRYEAAVTDIQLFLHANEADTSLGARFVMWEGALTNIPKKPVLGWNEQEYKQELQRLVDVKELDPVALQFADNLHNQYLQAWAFQGLLGLAALLALYMIPFSFFVRRLRAKDLEVRVWAFCGSALITGYFFFSMSQAILRRNNGIMFFLLALIIAWFCMRRAEKRDTLSSGKAGATEQLGTDTSSGFRSSAPSSES